MKAGTRKGLRFAGLVVALASAWAFVFTGCVVNGEGSKPGRSVIVQYLKAVETDNAPAAYKLMGKKYRKKTSLRKFMRYWRLYRPELLQQVRRIRNALKAKDKFHVEAVAHLKEGKKATLQWEKNGWRLRGGPGTEVGGGSPKSTLLALVRAIGRKDLLAFMQLLTERRREAFMRQMFLRLQKLKANLDRPLVITGRRIRFQYDSRYYIDLIKENGVWKVYDFN
jgi:hypothetical protein